MPPEPYVKRGLVREHRQVWEELHGAIPKGMVVHHRNGNKRDNRPENLELLLDSKHRSHHGKGRKQSATWVSRRMASMAWFHASGGPLARLTPEERSERARRAAQARWRSR